SKGTVWPVCALNYDEGLARLTYLFQKPLPAGTYSVVLPNNGGLSDLAGQSPVAARQSPGVLARFAVSAKDAAGPQGPNDLGAVLPDQAVAGISREGTLAPGISTTYRLSISYSSLYTFTLQTRGAAGLGVAASNAASAVSVRIIGPRGPL